MICISSKKLEHVLAERKLDSWAKVKYLILPSVFAVLFSGPYYVIRPYYGDRSPGMNINDIVLLLCGIISAYLTYRGIKQCFQSNQEIDGKAFFERFTILFVPPFIQIMVLSILLCLSILIPAGIFRKEIPFLYKYSTIFTAILCPVVIYILYLLIRNSFIRFGKLIKETDKIPNEGGGANR
jgi:hypothetical protein